MTRYVLFVALGWSATLLFLEGVACAQEPVTPTLRSSSRLVIVPTVVRSDTGEAIADLHTTDFQLSDNGVDQKILVEDEQKQGLAIVLLMQTGGAAPLQFQNYRTLNKLLRIVTGGADHKVALITFDSRPEEVWNFPPKTDGLEYAFRDPDAGDSGAAIMDAVNRSIDLLQGQPLSLRRIILLLSQPQDVGSSAHSQDLMRRLGESNATIYSITFSPEKRAQRNNAAQSPIIPPRAASEDQVPPMTTPESSVPLAVLRRMSQQTAAEMARLSGGDQVRLKDTNDLEHKLSILADDFAHTYSLSFQPGDTQPGFHSLVVLVKSKGHLVVSSRSAYWSP